MKTLREGLEKKLREQLVSCCDDGDNDDDDDNGCDDADEGGNDGNDDDNNQSEDDENDDDGGGDDDHDDDDDAFNFAYPLCDTSIIYQLLYIYHTTTTTIHFRISWMSCIKKMLFLG